ncbi:MAG: DUF2177 family protein [Xanthobacteraceae bacterium]|nr:DUF2177 family protein [Xanthobacteraceae bacterium]MBX3533558.1 DUF2177 family protein [Xanthobacteraceae bacterium]MBX3548347.1 DUF2177 family protein [Xanthobacteraceae bacterium]MCW5675673.1 DUF2177 family protein [Xanthobacteraceae bacterium]MCW5679280.1 DUF2177 family protein [Xanthobacteraceae bacterium]
MVRIISAYVATLAAFAVLDFLWIGTMANTLYRPVMKDILLADFRLAPAILFYLLYAFGIVLFAILPGLHGNEILRTVILGAALGLIAYGTYDLTNFATLKNWDTRITVIDMIWGGFATGLAAAAGYFGAALVERMLR